MTIAYREFGMAGPRMYTPEGPFTSFFGSGATPFPNFDPGVVTEGEAEAEYVSLIFAPVAAVTLNQGDFLWWDNSYTAQQTSTGAGSAPFGASVGTFFLGGRVGDPGALQGNQWSYTFQPGLYSIWAQRAGTSIGNIATGGTQTKPVNSTATLGQLSQPASPLAGSMGIQNVYAAAASQVFTANTTTGSTVLTNVSSNKFLVRGQALSGTGVATGAYIADISGTTVTMSAAATANGSGISITASNYATTGNITTGSPVITNVPAIPGVYPNQAIAGTGIPGSTTILGISGIPGNYSITMSANATATTVGLALTTTGYPEVLLRWPNVNSQN